MSSTIDHIREQLLGHEELSQWPEFVELVNRQVREGGIPCWEYAVLACRAEGADPAKALPATVALFCQLYGIHLLDDLIDEDPEGKQHKYGIGTVANLASAFQGLAITALAESDLPDVARHEALRRMGRMQVDTCWGQQLDAWDAQDEEGYWRLARTKTPPLFGFALALGALCAGSSVERAAEYDELGVSLGLLVQVSDDASDALTRPARADWQRHGSNLAILFARSTDHEHRDRFVELTKQIDDEASLREAQETLVRCGAFSYCAYKIVEFSRDARAKVAELDPPDPAPLLGFVEHLIRPLVTILERVGVESPADLIRGSSE